MVIERILHDHGLGGTNCSLRDGFFEI